MSDMEYILLELFSKDKIYDLDALHNIFETDATFSMHAKEEIGETVSLFIRKKWMTQVGGNAGMLTKAQITKLGKDVFQQENLRRLKERENKDIDNRIKRVDVVTKEFFYKYRWLPWGFSAGALLISAVSLFIAFSNYRKDSASSKKESQKIPQQTTPKFEHHVQPHPQKDTLKRPS